MTRESQPRVAVAIRARDGSQHVTAWSDGIFAGALRKEAGEAANEGALVQLTPTLEVEAEADTELGAIASIVLASGTENTELFTIRVASDRTIWRILEAEALAFEAQEQEAADV